ncbi:MAG TPA: LL-diaminopimelate aminotransferase, partial [Armatimonadetes bacterium]|nr:LL-diaminopimelate aminotransferase [Armatimonadota bacterium]
EIHSLSKTFNMTGWRVGWAWGGGDHVEALSRAKSNVDSGTFMAIQRAAAVGLENYDAFAPQMQAEYLRRRDALIAGLQSLGCPIEAPRAAFYVWVPVPEGYTSEGFATKLLGDCQVLAIPGAVYGAAGEGFVRMSLTIKGADKLAQIDQAISNMRDGGVAW